MSLAFALPTPMPAPNPGGRPPLPVSRADKIRCVRLLLLRQLVGKEASVVFDASRRTICRWRAELLADMQPDTDGLRMLADSRRN